MGGYGGGFADIYVTDADGTNTRRLVKGCDGCGPIAWSPDSSRIAFGSLDYSSEPWTGIVSVVNAVGGGEQVLCTDCGVPAWSPDGTRLAVVIGNTLYTIDPNGSDRRELTTSPTPRVCSDFPCDQLVPQAAQPSWSPDGTRIAFVGTDGLYVVGADGTDAERVVDQSEGLGAPV